MNYLSFILTTTAFLACLISPLIFLIYAVIISKKVNMISKVALRENVKFNRWCAFKNILWFAYFPDELIKTGDSEKMLEAKRKLVVYIKRIIKFNVCWVLTIIFIGLIGQLLSKK